MHDRDRAPLGTLSVLNVGAGDLKFSFDKSEPGEVERARKTIEDMLRRGYALLVEADGVLTKATGFDPGRDEYVLADPPAAKAPTAAKGKPGRRGGRVAASRARATAIAPTGGG